MVKAAPQAAPLEMPSVNGSASGLRNIACKVIPHSDNPPPAKKPIMVRGIRMENKILHCNSFSAKKNGFINCIPIKGETNTQQRDTNTIQKNFIKIPLGIMATFPPGEQEVFPLPENEMFQMQHQICLSGSRFDCFQLMNKRLKTPRRRL